ncbi:MAG: hypothetical protein HOV94_11200 [Saccharothrix sp.]|nr:hypothetical protein [Saccharothrix sp.]
MEVLLPPGTRTGPTALAVPLTGHNLLLTITADEQDVIVERIAVTRASHTPMSASGVRLSMSRSPVTSVATR